MAVFMLNREQRIMAVAILMTIATLLLIMFILYANSAWGVGMTAHVEESEMRRCIRVCGYEF